MRQSTTMASAGRGWYPDPYDASRSRYWDGRQWTDHTQYGSPYGTPSQLSTEASYGLPTYGSSPTYTVTPQRARKRRNRGGVAAGLVFAAAVLGGILIGL